MYVSAVARGEDMGDLDLFVAEAVCHGKIALEAREIRAVFQRGDFMQAHERERGKEGVHALAARKREVVFHNLPMARGIFL